jgi:16S rRNA (uracil1498-N3)-methyltransferase
MNITKEKLYLNSVSLSDIELYYAPLQYIQGNKIIIEDDEFNHMVNVMRNRTGDEIYVTDGMGNIYRSVIFKILKTKVICDIKFNLHFENKLSNLTFCIPKLKSNDKIEFALEKSVELGITNFIIYNAKNSVAKGFKFERWQKIILSAMKQSLRSFLPGISAFNSLEEIKKLSGEFIIFEQNSERNISAIRLNNKLNYYFIFGPEGGLDREEIDLADKENVYSLGTNRLRTETAVITTAAIITLLKY